MSVFLLDTNVLIALRWANHIHHSAAKRWLASVSDSWATCPITECGFVRISSNARNLPAAANPKDALFVLKQIVQHERHVFWEDSVSLRNSSIQTSIRGHQQVTDAYLLALCLHRGGRLATFDQAIFALASTEQERESVVVLPT